MMSHTTPFADWIIVLPVVLGLCGAGLLLVLRQWIRVQMWVCVAVLLATLICDAALVSRVWSEGPVAMTMGSWLPPFGISFTADMLGAGFALAAAVAALLVTLYLQMDTPGAARRNGLYPLILLLVAGVSGAFLTGDLFNLYVWFEVTLIASFGLLVLAGNPLQLDGAVKYAVPNFLATTLFLLALGLIYGLLGTLNMADIFGQAAKADPALVTAVAALFLLAFGIKAAAFPVNAWLPASYHTPPAGIAALIAGLMTKVGAYALIRTMLLMPDAAETLRPVIFAAAAATMIVGPLGAIAETRLRRALGFVLIGGIGVILAGLSVVVADTVAGSALYVVHAVLTMTALYLVAGLIERATGTDDSRRMGGLHQSRPLLAALFFVLALAVAGVPPFLGFWPKLQLLMGMLVPTGQRPPSWDAMVLALLLNALLTLIAMMRLWARMFWRAAPAEGFVSAGGAADGYVAATLLTAIIVLAGLWPNGLIAAAQIAAGDLLDPARYIAAVGLAP